MTDGGSRRALGDRRRILQAIALGAAFFAVACPGPKGDGFPSEKTPEGAYVRIALAIAEGRLVDVFPYIEDEAQWASYTIRKERAAALARAEHSYPAEAFSALVAAYGPDARAADGADVFVRIGKARGWFGRMRRDLSGVARAEVDGDRATIVTARGTRYPMRRRTVGLWGLTSFTAELLADAERATRDRARVEEAARDYDLAAGHVSPDATDAAPAPDGTVGGDGG
jgi:hypothetical protein